MQSTIKLLIFSYSPLLHFSFAVHRRTPRNESNVTWFSSFSSPRFVMNKTFLNKSSIVFFFEYSHFLLHVAYYDKMMMFSFTSMNFDGFLSLMNASILACVLSIFFLCCFPTNVILRSRREEKRTNIR